MEVVGKFKKVYVGGTFDLFHVGHLNFLEKAAALGDYLVVSVNTDEFAESYKRRPVIPLEQRMAILSALKCVDKVVVNEGGADSSVAIGKEKPQIIAHGDDWTGEGYLQQLGISESFLEEHGIIVKYLPYTQGISTTAIINQL